MAKNRKGVIEHTAGKIVKGGEKAALTALPGQMPVAMLTQSLNSVVSAWQSYQEICQVEMTRREGIRAQRDVLVTSIKEKAESLRFALGKAFEERAHNFDNFFEMLNDGCANNDDKKINSALSLIVKQMQESPMAQAAQMISDMRNPDVKEIEI